MPTLGSCVGRSVEIELAAENPINPTKLNAAELALKYPLDAPKVQKMS
ncbi:hypothetical protein CP8484711_0111A, partial [Chlamydia psittaci 84-8471/1]